MFRIIALVLMGLAFLFNMLLYVRSFMARKRPIPEEVNDVYDEERFQKWKNYTILMSSHMLHEVSDMCDRIVMINHGTFLMEGNIDDVLGANSFRNISVKVVGGATKADADIISSMPNVQDVTYGGNTVRFSFKGDDEAQMQLLKGITSAGVKVYSMNEDEALESIYLNLIKESR